MLEKPQAGFKRCCAEEPGWGDGTGGRKGQAPSLSSCLAVSLLCPLWAQSKGTPKVGREMGLVVSPSSGVCHSWVG